MPGWGRLFGVNSLGGEDEPTRDLAAAANSDDQPTQFAVEIPFPDPDDALSGDAVTFWSSESGGEGDGSAAAAVPRPAIVDETVRIPLSSPALDGAPGTESLDDAPRGSAPPVSEVLGDVHVAQIVIGAASPKVEPKLIGEDYRSFPFRPDTVIDGWSSDQLTVRGASLRGHFHRYNGAPRQDDFAIHQLADGRVIALVADGVSQSRQSHLGATAAVRAAARWLKMNLAPATDETDWLGLVRDAAWALAEQARVTFDLADPDPAMALKEMSTTLICAVVEPSGEGSWRASIIGVGDSGAWLLRDGEFVPLLGGKAVGTGGISSSAVAGLPQVPNLLEPAVVEFERGQVLLLGTDGIGDPLGSGYGGVGNLFRDLLTRPEPPSLIEFAHAVDFSRETFDDDRTLVAVMPRTTAISAS